VALGREVQDGPGRVLAQQGVQQRAIADIALHEDMPGVALQAFQVGQVPCVREQVEVDDAFVSTRQPIEDEVAADEAGAACN